jgi:hypothetical protein
LYSSQFSGGSVCQILCNDIEHSPGQFRYFPGVLELPVGRTGVQQVGKRELMDVTQPLDWAAVEHPAFLYGETTKPVNRVTDFM